MLKAKLKTRERADKDEAIKELSKPKIRRLNADIEVSLHQRLKMFCAYNRTSIREVLHEALTEYLKRHANEEIFK